MPLWLLQCRLPPYKHSNPQAHILLIYEYSRVSIRFGLRAHNEEDTDNVLAAFGGHVVDLVSESSGQFFEIDGLSSDAGYVADGSG